MSFLPIEMLRDGACELGIQLDDSQIESLDKFALMIVETNRFLNLTRITEPVEIVKSHYLDSFTCLAALTIPQGARIIDIGAGAGLPGIPIKIARPDLEVTLLDSSRKKLKFVEEAIAQLGIEGVNFVHARAEEAGRNPAHREAYDVALARALAEMKILVELCLPLVKVGGTLIAQKSDGAKDEINTARPFTGQLGGKIDKIKRITVPCTDITRRLVIISKSKPTPLGFPRSYSQIAKGKSQRESQTAADLT